MKTRYLFTLALATLAAYVLSAGCTQDFDAFQPCADGEKVCGDACVSVTDPAFGCTTEGCTPCELAHATSACDSAGCAIEGCLGTFEDCDGSAADGCEIDPLNDAANCGACGKACVTPHADPACAGGECAVGACAPGYEDCDGMVANGCEANLQSSPQTCGSCDVVCGPFETCQNGQCVLDCDPGTADCDGDPENGCETTLGTNANCASCGDACDLAHASASCAAGTCAIDACDPGFDDCDGLDADGCEADLLNSAMTCGSCAACPDGPNGTTVCDNGQCAINCTAGFGNCDGDVANGCETDTDATAAHCGGCGQACTPANGVGACSGGSCQIMTCTAPFADCDGDVANGCETDTSTDSASCGMCGMGCSFANAGAICAGGVCELGACDAGFKSCDGDPANGCEMPVSADPLNCGDCGVTCPAAPNAAPACANGACGLSCDPGFENCDGDPANGCETSIATSVTDCGACGRACSGTNVASKSCTGGVCDSSCNLGFANCSMPAAPSIDNGCEVNAASNDASCGGCGNTCGQQGNPGNGFECDQGFLTQHFCGCSSASECNAGASGNCSGGLCVCNGVQCRTGEACVNAGGVSSCSCNGGPGCATNESCCDEPAGCFDLRNDAQSCGACGHACAPGFVCFDMGAFQAPECRCDDAADCDAGTAGAFSCNATGRCVCNGTTCAQGKRCLPNGQCG